MLHGHVLEHLLVVLAAAIPFALLLRRLGQSTIVGYLLAGLVLGPGGLRLIPPDSIALLAEVGVGLLLFEVGIELSIERLGRMRRVAPVIVCTSAPAEATPLVPPGVRVISKWTDLKDAD